MFDTSYSNYNRSYIIEVFRSPENYRERYGGNPELRLPKHTPMYSYAVDGTAQLSYTEVILRRYKASFHISEEFIDNYCPYRGSLYSNYNEANRRAAWIATVIKKVSELTYQQLKLETWDDTHNTILDGVKIIFQENTDRILIDLSIYACRARELELAQQAFQELFYRVAGQSSDFIATSARTLSNNCGASAEELAEAFRVFSQRNLIDPDVFRRVKETKYDKKAEERAIELLKNMLKPQDFKNYKENGYVIVKGKSGKTYKVKKHGIIEVSYNKALGVNLKKEFYRLCIEPKEHGTICPTDEVIAKIKLIQADEDILHKRANRLNNSGPTGSTSGTGNIGP